MSIVVIGLGNLLLADEGVGVHVAREMARRPLPPGIEVLDVGTAVLDAAPALERADVAIVVDAMVAGQAAGTVYRHTLDELQPKPIIGSMHGFDLPRVMALACRTSHPRVVVVGVEPQHIGWSLELSPPVAAAVPGIIEVVLEEVAASGLEVRRESA